MLTAENVLDRYFLDTRCSLIELAAMLDRYDRSVRREGGGDPEADDRLDRIYQALTLLADREAVRSQ